MWMIHFDDHDHLQNFPTFQVSGNPTFAKNFLHKIDWERTPIFDKMNNVMIKGFIF